MSLRGNWRIPTEILAGAGRIAELPARVKAAGIARVLVVTDPGVAGLPFLANIIKLFEAEGIATALFKDLHPDPLLADILAGAAAYKAHNAEAVIAIGGGSGLDTGKSIALAVSTSRPLWDFEITLSTPAVDSDLPPIFAVPTTAGTGSEVGRATVVIDVEKQRKYILLHAQMLPRLVILDPELTYGLPATITAWTGMDALAHSLEAYYATFYHPAADGIALEGMRLVKENLLTAVSEPRNEDARMNMLVAASLGATAFQKALGAIHALAHPIGARFHSHHGLTNAILMPYVLVFNRPVVESRINRAAQALGIENGFDGFLAWIIELRAVLNIPHTLEGLKIPAEALEDLAAEAVADPNTPDNPRIASQEDYVHILQAALSGVFTGLA